MLRFENIVMKDMSLRVMMRLNLQVVKKYLEDIIHNHHDNDETGEGVLFQLYLFLQWLDSRIQFNNIREDEFKNDVSAHKQEVGI